MELFSQRYGYKPVKSVIQIETMDEDLRNGLWNAIDIYYWKTEDRHDLLSFSSNNDVALLFSRLWLNYFKKPVDTISPSFSDDRMAMREYFLGCDFNECYDIIEFLANNYPDDEVNKRFMEYCNYILKREVAGFRFVGNRIIQITSEEEITEIEQALASKDSLESISIHLQTALSLISNRKSPDYRNSIKESISAVETISRLITNKDKSMLPEALKALTNKGVDLHPALKDAFIKLYGYTSDADGIRHSLIDEPSLDFEDAKFMLVSCSAFINYLKTKSSKAGIKLEID